MAHVICDLCERRSKILCHFIAASFAVMAILTFVNLALMLASVVARLLINCSIWHLVMGDLVMIDHLTDDSY
jgi:hypothetical protein